MSTKSTTADRAKGRWPQILRELGIDDEFLQNRHGPCPCSGGRDRYRFDNKDGRGTYYCSKCGPGDGFDLACKVTGMSFADVAKEIDGMLGTVDLKPEPFEKKPDMEKRRKALASVWSGAKDRRLAAQYLRERGITNVEGLTKDLNFHPALQLFDEKGKRTGKLQAMIAVVRAPDGEPCTIHRTYLKPGLGRIKKLMPPTRTMTGGAVRLISPVEGRLVLAEGIESALAGRELYLRDFGRDIGCWSTISANNMEAVVLPADLREVVIFADSDRSFTGQAAAFRLAKRLMTQGNKRMRVMVLVPEQSGNDAVDVLAGRCGYLFQMGEQGDE